MRLPLSRKPDFFDLPESEPRVSRKQPRHSLVVWLRHEQDYRDFTFDSKEEADRMSETLRSTHGWIEVKADEFLLGADVVRIRVKEIA